MLGLQSILVNVLGESLSLLTAAWRTPPWLASGWGCPGRRPSRASENLCRQRAPVRGRRQRPQLARFTIAEHLRVPIPDGLTTRPAVAHCLAANVCRIETRNIGDETESFRLCRTEQSIPSIPKHPKPGGREWLVWKMREIVGRRKGFGALRFGAKAFICSNLLRIPRESHSLRQSLALRPREPIISSLRHCQRKRRGVVLCWMDTNLV